MPAVVEVLSSSSEDDEVAVPLPPPPPKKEDGPSQEPKPQDAAGADEATPSCSAASSDSAEGATTVDKGFGPVPANTTEESELVTVDLAECNRRKLRGNELFGQGKVAEALAEYRKAILKAPIKPIQKPKRSSEAEAAAAELASEGEAATSQDDPDMEKPDVPKSSTGEAVAEGEEEQPDTTDYTLTSQAFCNAGYCLMKLEVYEEAVDMLSEAIRHDEKYVKAYVRRADSYYYLEKWSSAYGDYESFVKLGGVLDAGTRARHDVAKKKTDEEMQKMLGDLKDLGNRFLSNFGLSTDMFKFDKDPNTGSYSMRFERN